MGYIGWRRGRDSNPGWSCPHNDFSASGGFAGANETDPYKDMNLKLDGGGAGIRTLGGVAPTTIFETVPFNHSGTSPMFEILVSKF